MRSTKDLGKGLMVAAVIVLIAMPVWAGNGKGKGTGAGNGSGSGSRTKSQTRDGSCQDAMEQQESSRLLAGDAIRDYIRQQKRLKDGSYLVVEGEA